ncbi:MAG: YccF domain-containing protein, partial [Eubacteriales bacterium]|nr:YccF domain-containing protein [Eubacteriales bacterium]
MLAPFGREIDYSQAGTISFLANILWILLLGWELAVTAVVIGLVYCVTIVGIPFGLQSFKFARLALMPFGARIVRV